MKIVVAMDKLKGSLDARAACDAVARGLRIAMPDATIVTAPLADGGDCTTATLMGAFDGEWTTVNVMGPLPSISVDASYAFFQKQKLSVVEMAKSSGLALLEPLQRNPLLTTTYGTGQLLEAAFARPGRVWLAVGGSATVDGGVGAAQALGWIFLDEHDRPVGQGGGELERIRRIVPPARKSNPPVEVLCDVTNPLVGERGAACVFGPQKGATPEMVRRLEAGLQNLAERVRTDLGTDIAPLTGGGAAGGLAAGAVAFFGARLVSGVEKVIDAIGLAQTAADADYIITGEGRLDESSFTGKVVSGVVDVAKRSRAPVIVIAGQSAVDEKHWRAHGVSRVLTLCRAGVTEAAAMTRAAELLYDCAREASAIFNRGA